MNESYSISCTLVQCNIQSNNHKNPHRQDKNVTVTICITNTNKLQFFFFVTSEILYPPRARPSCLGYFEQNAGRVVKLVSVMDFCTFVSRA